MILYLDASALVKRYLSEPGAQIVASAIDAASLVGTAVVSRTEMAAALAKAVRMDALTHQDAWAALQTFRAEWGDYVQIQATQALIARADTLAWDHGLRGYDAVHLAAGIVWQESMNDAATFMTFDLRLWHAAGRAGLMPRPDDLPGLLDGWRTRPA